MSENDRLEQLRQLVGSEPDKPTATPVSQQDARLARLRQLHEAGADYSGKETIKRIFGRLGRR